MFIREEMAEHEQGAQKGQEHTQKCNAIQETVPVLNYSSLNFIMSDFVKTVGELMVL